MTSSETLYAGVDITSGRRPITYAILDTRLRVKTLADSTLDEMAELLKKADRIVCAIDAPSGGNKGLLTKAAVRKKVGLDPKAKSYSSYRLGEYEIRRRGISIYPTPLEEDDAKSRIQTGWRLYEALREADFVTYPQQGSRRMLETHPHGGFTVMIGVRPYSKTSLEGRLQRQLVLYKEGVEVPDPMYILEEWTRHRLLHGELVDDKIYNPDQLDALMAAYTAFLVDREAKNVSALGDPDEGLIVLPAGDVKDSYG
jgi:predicted nuclease with RNAse H fold